MLSVLELIKYTLDEDFLSAERPYQRDLSTEAYLQIADDMPPDRIMVFNLQNVSMLIADAVVEKFSEFA